MAHRKSLIAVGWTVATFVVALFAVPVYYQPTRICGMPYGLLEVFGSILVGALAVCGFLYCPLRPLWAKIVTFLLAVLVLVQALHPVLGYVICLSRAS
ncbi:hypothetical protein [Parathermosynechococcus lividus]